MATKQLSAQGNDEQNILAKLRSALITHWSPGGNDTYLILSSDIEKQEYPAAESILRSQFPILEQGGYIVKPKRKDTVLRLEMAGGEFCGNATRCLGAFIASDLKTQKYSDLINYDLITGSDENLRFEVETSGMPGTVPIQCSACDENWDVAIEIPLIGVGCRDVELIIDKIKIPAQLVILPGISHFLVNENAFPFISETNWQKRLFDQVRKQITLKADAYGFVWFSANESGFAIKPLVWVPATGSCTLETACGSGSLAMALSTLQSSQPVPVTQLSGKVLSVSFKGATATLAGIVERRENIGLK